MRAKHDGRDHCCATFVGVHLDTEGAGGIGAHCHTERGSLIHEEHSLPLCCDPAAAHCIAPVVVHCVGATRPLSTTHARYLPPQVVVQVNGCDTPTLGAVVDVVSAQASPATAKLLPHTLLEHLHMHGLSRCRL